MSLKWVRDVECGIGEVPEGFVAAKAGYDFYAVLPGNRLVKCKGKAHRSPIGNFDPCVCERYVWGFVLTEVV